MKRFVFALSAALLTALIASPAPSFAQSHGRGDIVLPDSSSERDEDHGNAAHTNHVIFVDPTATSGSPTGETPQTLRPVYNLPSTGGSGVIAIVIAYDYPTATNDFNVFSRQFGLPVETGNKQVFQVVYAGGKKPRGNSSWNQEAALDIEWSHAMAPNAKIVLVEGQSNSFSNLFAAVQTANGVPGVTQISMSWGGSEFSGETSYDSYFRQPGVVYFAASGDTGGKTIYPGVSPNVVCAGGTRINRTTQGNPTTTFIGETGWSGSGGGQSQYESRPAYQAAIATTIGPYRGVPDVSFDADPSSGVSVYDSTPSGGLSGWLVFGGTSVASPSLAGVVNLCGSGNTSSANELSEVYSGLGSSNFNDIIGGTAGSFTAGSGWDLVTGVGSVNGTLGK